MFHFLTATDADQRLAELDRFIEHRCDGCRNVDRENVPARAVLPRTCGSIRG